MVSAGVVLLGVLGTSTPISSAIAASAATPKVVVPKFKNCAAMNKQYPGGVARVGAHDKRASGHASHKPYVNTVLYNVNRALDRDHDGISCEK